MSFRNSFSNFKWKKFFGWIGLIVLLGLGTVVYFQYYAVFSDGYRAGTLIKFSRKGYIFKTYEGEINQGGIANPSPGTAMANQIWSFSVRKKEVADKLDKMEGKVVRLHYKQFNRMFPWEGDTPYLVNEVEVVE
ncbi:MAG: hypothetical protein H6577_23400 [Lewinellaceae bacterium]|nr:hypothetical protein [Saprospiraceae bacterium]MCB9341083.1 hypothetical protein [Lewinellaceae bacterium]